MPTMYFMKQRAISLALVSGAIFLLLTACSSGNSATQTAQPTSTTVTSASAIIRHSPSGVAILHWDHTSQDMTVQLSLTGLEPKSVHPVRIVAGNCKSPGKVLYDLPQISTTQIGFADLKTQIKAVDGGIPETGWSVIVSNGPGTSADDQAMPISCANVFNPSVSTKASQDVQATLLNAFSPNQNVTGTADLAINNNQLQVKLTLKGLQPDSKHVAHIHTGSCASQGAIKYDLQPVVANASGEATTTTVIPGITAIPRNGWYVNVHLGNSSSAIKSQAGDDPIACGDITQLH